MKKFRLSTDILSPIHSDISLNDSSAFSFSNISGMPDFGKEIGLSTFESPERDSNIDSVCKTTLKESSAAFDVIVNDIKKQSNINAEKEERFKDSYKMLKLSMDELFNKVSHPSVLSPLSNDINLENVNRAEKMPARKKTDTVTEIPQNLKKDSDKNESTKSKTVSQISSTKSRRKESTLGNKKKDSNQQPKNVRSLKECTEHSEHSKNKASLKKEMGANGSNSVCGLQNLKTSKMVSSSTQTCEYSEAVEPNGKENLKNFYSEKQRRPETSNSMSATENKNLSIEESIQIAISMEMDNLRRFMMEHNLCVRKDLMKLKETAKKQREVTGYLFSVIEELVEENKKLISNRNKK